MIPTLIVALLLFATASVAQYENPYALEPLKPLQPIEPVGSSLLGNDLSGLNSSSLMDLYGSSSTDLYKTTNRGDLYRNSLTELGIFSASNIMKGACVVSTKIVSDRKLHVDRPSGTVFPRLDKMIRLVLSRKECVSSFGSAKKPFFRPSAPVRGGLLPTN